MLGREPAVDLVGGRGEQVITVVATLAESGDGVGARGDRLRLEGFEIRVGDGSELARDDAEEVVLDGELVDGGEGSGAVDADSPAPR